MYERINPKKTNYSDDTALNALKSGDTKAFKWIYNKYYHLLCSYAERIIDSRDAPEEAENIVQDLFMKLWESRKTIVVTKSLNAYLNGSVRNSCLKHIEHLNVIREHQDSVLAESSAASDNDNPMSMLIAKETEHEIERAITALPEKYRQIIALMMQEELSYDQIAQKLGIPVGSVGPQLNRARKMIFNHLNKRHKRK